MSHEAEIHEEHEEHVNHEAWVIPYADLLTLLMAMFIALFAMSTVDTTKFKSLSIGLNEALGGGKLDTGVFAGAKGNAPLNGSGNGNGTPEGVVAPGDSAQNAQLLTQVLERTLTARQQLEADKARETQTLTDVERAIQDA